MTEVNQKFFSCVTVAASLLGLVGCSSDSTGSSGPSAADKTSVVKTYAENLAAGYSDAVDDETAHQTVVGKFLEAPTDANLTAAQKSWLAAREHYMLTEGARFYAGPIDIDTPDRPSREGLINSWPLDENYIDYTTDAKGVVNETVGIVNDPKMLKDITASGLDDLNAMGSDTSISAGYHAVEFLLWGQALNATGPGERPASDYDLKGTRLNPDRRAEYVKVAIAGLITHLTEVRDAWATDAEYRVAFEADADAALTKIFTGLAKFSKGELASQRIGAAYMSKERHDQHDCFSSETLVDYERDARGIQNMYLGRYGDNQGMGLDDLVHAVDPAEDTKLQGMIQDSIDAIVAIPTPFEASIAGADDSPGRVAIAKALDALSKQGDEFGTAAAALGYRITVDDAPAAQ